jgi:hypothetical protein
MVEIGDVPHSRLGMGEVMPPRLVVDYHLYDHYWSVILCVLLRGSAVCASADLEIVLLIQIMIMIMIIIVIITVMLPIRKECPLPLCTAGMRGLVALLLAVVAAVVSSQDDNSKYTNRLRVWKSSADCTPEGKADIAYELP